MIVINLIKVAAIRLADIINTLYYPFEKREYWQISTLDRIEQESYVDLQDRFVDKGRFSYELPMPSDHGDEALFQGLYVAMMNLKHVETTPDVQAANQALGEFFRDGILIRGVKDNGEINDTTSNDAGSGVLFGLYCIWRKGTFEADATIQRWADRIIEANYALTDLEGNPTKFGQLEQGWKTDPLRLTLLLAILILAHKTTHQGGGVYSAKYYDHYSKLRNRYKALLPYPKAKLLWFDTDYDTHRAAIHLHILFSLTRAPEYAKGLRRLLKITKAENNAWVQTLCYASEGQKADFGILSTFSPARRREGNIRTINDVPSVKWGDKVRSTTALPVYLRGSQEFFWQRNSFSKDEWAGTSTADKFHSGLDFLVCYWLAVRLGLLEGTH